MKILIAALGGLILAAGGSSVAAWAVYKRFARPTQSVPPDTTQPFDPASWAWRGEEHWAVDQMVRDATEILLFAAGEAPASYTIAATPTNAVEHGYTLTLSGPKFRTPLTRSLVLEEHLWNPAPLLGWTQQVVSGLGLAASVDPGQDKETLTLLLNPAPRPLERTQAKASETLTRHPASPSAQEQAAAVLSVFGLFNRPGVFEDNRFVLCRIAAHLAVADGLRGAPSQRGACGQFASAALLLMTGQTRKAVQWMEASGRTSGIPEPWLNVLEMMAKRDGRKVVDPAQASPAEVLAAYSGRCYRMSSQEALDWLDGVARRPRMYPAYLTRTAFMQGYSVELGHELTPEALDLDLQDLQAVYKSRNQNRAIPENELCTVLNALPRRAFAPDGQRLQILDWGIWARHFQASLLLDMMSTFDFYEDKWGVKDTANEYLDTIERRFQGLDLFPFLQKRYAYARPSIYQPAILRAADYARRHPEFTPDSSFVCVQKQVPQGTHPMGLPRYRDWLAIPAPFGTAYNLAHRSWEMAEMAPLRTSGLERFRDLDPYDAWLIKQALKIQFPEGKPTPEAVEAVFAESKALDERLYLDWMIDALGKENPKALEFQKKLASLDPSEYFSLGHALKQQKREPEAAEAYLKGFRECQDRVQASNNAEWLVPYLYRTGRTEEAESVAKECAEVYSSRGLGTMAALREQQGRLEEAEDWYQKIEKRYDSPGERMAFYQRHQNLPAYKTKFEKAIRATFPGGLIRYTPASQPPKRGVGFASHSALMEKWGVTPQAIIVAVDGYQVENQKQYFTVRDFSKDERMTLVIYQKGAYQTIEVTLPSRRFGVDMSDFSGS